MNEIELKDLRKPREKHFLLKNGNITAKVYDEVIHYKKGEEYEEIDNTLVKEKDYFYNKENSYKVFLKEKSVSNFFKIEIDNHFIQIDIKDINMTIQLEPNIILFENK